MKSFIVAACIVACAYAGAVSDDKSAQILRSDSQQTPDGNFQYAFETDNGINAQVSGNVKPVGKDEVALEVTGSNSYISPEGIPIKVSYIANEEGYQATGDHLPTPPAPEPIPEYIQRAIAYIAAHPYVEEKQK